jgi:hypothetical protein
MLYAPHTLSSVALKLPRRHAQPKKAMLANSETTSAASDASGPNPPNEIYVVTEITRGGRNKYEYKAKQGVFMLDRVLYTYYPCDYGFIPPDPRRRR